MPGMYTVTLFRTCLWFAQLACVVWSWGGYPAAAPPPARLVQAHWAGMRGLALYLALARVAQEVEKCESVLLRLLHCEYSRRLCLVACQHRSCHRLARAHSAAPHAADPSRCTACTGHINTRQAPCLAVSTSVAIIVSKDAVTQPGDAHKLLLGCSLLAAYFGKTRKTLGCSGGTHTLRLRRPLVLMRASGAPTTGGTLGSRLQSAHCFFMQPDPGIGARGAQRPGPTLAAP